MSKKIVSLCILLVVFVMLGGFVYSRYPILLAEIRSLAEDGIFWGEVGGDTSWYDSHPTPRHLIWRIGYWWGSHISSPSIVVPPGSYFRYMSLYAPPPPPFKFPNEDWLLDEILKQNFDSAEIIAR